MSNNTYYHNYPLLCYSTTVSVIKKHEWCFKGCCTQEMCKQQGLKPKNQPLNRSSAPLLQLTNFHRLKSQPEKRVIIYLLIPSYMWVILLTLLLVVRIKLPIKKIILKMAKCYSLSTSHRATQYQSGLWVRPWVTGLSFPGTFRNLAAYSLNCSMPRFSWAINLHLHKSSLRTSWVELRKGSRARQSPPHKIKI